MRSSSRGTVFIRKDNIRALGRARFDPHILVHQRRGMKGPDNPAEDSYRQACMFSAETAAGCPGCISGMDIVGKEESMAETVQNSRCHLAGQSDPPLMLSSFVPLDIGRCASEQIPKSHGSCSSVKAGLLTALRSL